MLFLVVSCSAFSQHGNPLQFLSDVSQASRANPAFQNKTEKLIVGLPVISGSHGNLESNFSAEDFLTEGTESSFFDFAKLYSNLEEPGSVFTMAQIPLLFLSLKKDKNTFSFAVSEKAIGIAGFDEELLNFFAQGIEPYYGKNENIGTISMQTQYYRELEFGFASELWKGFTIGVRPKIIFGKLHYEVDQINLLVTTDEETETLWVESEGSFTISGPVKLKGDEESDHIYINPDIKPADYFFKLKNLGAGIDLGATYQINSQTQIGMAIIDLGFTSIKHKSYTITLNEPIDYARDELYQSYDPEAPNYQSPQDSAEKMNDRLHDNTETQALSNRKIESLPIQLNLHLKYALQANVEIGAANNFTYYKSDKANNFSGYVHTKLGERFSTVASLNLFNFDKLMAGIGAAYTGKSAQFYFATNNILELARPKSTNNLNLSFGVNFLLSTN